MERQAFTLVADAQDKDGEVVSIEWHHDSEFLSKVAEEQGGRATFVSNDIQTDHQVTFTATATDNSGAQTQKSHTVTIKRNVVNVMLNGTVTGSSILNAAVSLDVAGRTTEFAVNTDGEYFATLSVDEHESDALVRLTAVGGSGQPEVKFVSLLDSVGSLVAQAGEDNILTKDENFAVNVTNVTTAEYALASRNSQVIDDELSLTKALVSIDANEQLELAALIKIVVDNEEYSLPNGVETTLELAQNEVAATQLADHINHTNATLIAQTKQEIIANKDLVYVKTGFVPGNYVVHSPKYKISPVYHIKLDNHGQGYVAALNKAPVKHWAYSEGVVRIELTEPLITDFTVTPRLDEFGHWVVDEQGAVVNDPVEQKTTQLSLRLLADNPGFQTAELDSHVQEFINGELNTNKSLETKQIINLQHKDNGLQISAEDLLGKTWYLDLEAHNNQLHYQGTKLVAKLVFNQDGSITQTSELGKELANTYLSWSLQGPTLTLHYKQGEATKSLQLMVTKPLLSGFQVVALQSNAISEFNQGRATSQWGWLIHEQNKPNITEQSMIGRWTGFLGYEKEQHEMLIRPELDVWIGFQHNRYDGRVDDNIFYRELYDVTENGRERICTYLDGQCLSPFQIRYEFIAQVEDIYFIKRSSISSPGTSYEEVIYESLVQYRYSPDVDHSEFKASQFDTAVTFYTTTHTGEPDEIKLFYRDDALILQDILGEYPVEIIDGTLSFEVNGKTRIVEIVADFGEGLTVCAYHLPSRCQEENKVDWYLTELARQ
ncbi:hypothetical protein C3B51_13690 [Pseudoalteromonas rubra]|uniref:Uncharacterized protein n=2 Tax=Pseudoalteromonas rubra TaxID=43658 RepID=A0A4Q7EFB1_9GAMM|nr:hypothetical protein C3B51_13690 [Pseudoalteromonas rubra]